VADPAVPFAKRASNPLLQTLLDAYAQVSYEREVEDWLRCFIDTGWPAKPGTQWKLLTVGRDKVLLSSAANKGWANVFAKEDETYMRFGYNIEEERWAYGSEPEGSSVIVAAIRSLDQAPRDPGLSATTHGKSSGRKPLKRNRSRMNRRHVAVFALLAILLFVWWKNKDSGESKTTSNVSSQERTPAKPWTVRTVREVRVKDPTGVIPAGTKLRVIGRAGNDLFVSYNGSRVTIPASATDLP
jgi:hypothetical protein